MVCYLVRSVPVAPTIRNYDLAVGRNELCRDNAGCAGALAKLEASIGFRTLARTVGVRPNAPQAESMKQSAVTPKA